jgi:hypothetical protein
MGGLKVDRRRIALLACSSLGLAFWTALLLAAI